MILKIVRYISLEKKKIRVSSKFTAKDTHWNLYLQSIFLSNVEADLKKDFSGNLPILDLEAGSSSETGPHAGG